MGREVSNADEWEKLPVGTVARIDTFDVQDDGTEKDIVVYVIRVEGSFKAAAGDYMLAGGAYWSEAWMWGEGGAVLDLNAAFTDT